MDLAPVIKALLFEHNYVVVPDFGGFVGREKASELNRLNFSILPPSKSVLFNPELKSDDGLLAQALVQQKMMSYAEAQKLINKQVESWNEKLFNREIVDLEGLGKIQRSLDGSLSFKQSAPTNLLKESFGLEFAKAVPVRKVKRKASLSHNKTETQTTIIEQIPVSYRRFQRASIALIAILTITAGYLYMLSFKPEAMEKAGLNFFDVPIIAEEDLERLEASEAAKRNLLTKQQEEKAAATPQKSSPSEISVEEKPVQEGKSDVDSKDDKVIEQQNSPTEEKSPPAEKEEEQKFEVSNVENVENTTEQFHVIVASLSGESKMKEVVSTYRSKGYDPIIIPTDEGRFRVSLGRFASKDSAQTFKSNIFNDNDINSWILKK